MKKLLVFMLLIFAINSNSQELKQFEKINLACKKYLSKEKGYDGDVKIYTIHNRINKDSLKNGIYGFSRTANHSKGYFLIYQNGDITILDLTTLEKLKNTINLFLDFATEQRYCDTIINDYINRFIKMYFHNAKRNYMPDLINCDKSINIKDLP